MKIIFWTPAALWAALIFVASHQTLAPGLKLLGGRFDLVVHAGVYAILAAALAWGATRGGKAPLTWKLVVVLVAAASIYGLSDEWHQSWVPRRDASLLDWLADTVGAAACLSGLCFFQTIFLHEKN